MIHTHTKWASRAIRKMEIKVKKEVNNFYFIGHLRTKKMRKFFRLSVFHVPNWWMCERKTENDREQEEKNENIFIWPSVAMRFYSVVCVYVQVSRFEFKFVVHLIPSGYVPTKYKLVVVYSNGYARVCVCVYYMFDDNKKLKQENGQREEKINSIRVHTRTIFGNTVWKWIEGTPIYTKCSTLA